MLEGPADKIKKVLSSNFLFDKGIRLLYVILSLYLGANFFSEGDFYLLQQINLFQSFLIFSLGIPVNSLLIRIGNSSLNYFKTLIPGITVYRLLFGTFALIFLFFYLYIINQSFSDISIILIGLVPVLLNSIILIEVLPHIVNFDGEKNWKLIYIYIFMFILKCLSMIIFRNLEIKIILEILEAVISLVWLYFSYLKGQIFFSWVFLYNSRVVKLIKTSLGLFLNGIFSVFILRIDQFSLINLVEKKDLSIYMLIVSISSLFLTPMTLFSERIGFTLSIAKTKSIKDFHLSSVKALWSFLIGSVLLYVVFIISVGPLANFVFKRNIDDFKLISVVLGTSIIWNSIGMVFGQINSIINGGMFTMKRTLMGCFILFVFVHIGFKFSGVIGVATASAFCLFLTNIIFWFFSTKVRKIVFFTPSK